MPIQQMLLGAAETIPPQQEYLEAGNYTWVCPAGVTSVSIVAIGPGGAGENVGPYGGGGGGCAYKNNITVVPGTGYAVVVGAPGAMATGTTGTGAGQNTGTAGGDSSFTATHGTTTAQGGKTGSSSNKGSPAGSYDGGGNDAIERMRIDSSGSLSTTSGSAVSYFSNGQSTGSGDATHLIAQDLDEMQKDDSDNTYHRMKALKVTKSGKLRIRWTGRNQSGTYYWSWLISKTGGGTGNLSDIPEVSPKPMKLTFISLPKTDYIHGHETLEC